MPKSYQKLLCFFVIWIMILLTACNKEQIAPNKTTELKSVNVVQSSCSLLYLPLYLANDLGFFEKEGLLMHLETSGIPESDLNNLFTADIPFLLVSPETVFYHLQQENSSEIVFLAQTAVKSGYYLLARKSNPSFVWQDLKGKSVIGCNNGELSQIIFEYILKKNNLQPFLNVHIMQNIPHRLIEGTYLAGTGNYILANEPLASALEKKSDSYITAVIDLPSASIITAAVITTSDYFESNPAVCQSFANALQQSLTWIDEHSPEDIVSFGKQYFPYYDDKTMLRAVSRYKTLGCWPLSAGINVHEQKMLEDFMLENQEINPQSFFNN